MRKPISFRPTQENLDIFNEVETTTNLDRTLFINRAIIFYSRNIGRIPELEREKRSQEILKNTNELALNGLLEDKRKAIVEFQSQLKTANSKIEELKTQSSKYQEDNEILKSKNKFLTTQTSALDKSTLKELETLRAKVAEQSKQVSSLTTRVTEQANELVALNENVSNYESPYLQNAFEKVKGKELTVQHEGIKDVKFKINIKADLVKALSYQYHLNFLKK